MAEAIKIRFYPTDMNYRIMDDKPVMMLFGRAADDTQICVIDDSFEPYFWVVLKDRESINEFRKKAEQLKIESNEGISEVKKTETHKKKFLGKDIEAVKVFTKYPGDVPVIKDILREWETVEKAYETDIPFARRYLIDKRLTPMTLVEAEGSFVNMQFKVPVFKADKIKQFSDDSLQNPRVLAFDIETYNPAGKISLPEKNPIIMIGLYGENFRKVLTWKRFETDEDYIEFTDSELTMIERFVKLTEEYSPDILAGYFSDNFDLPYLKTRAEKYKITLNLGLDNSALTMKKGKKTSAKFNGIIHLDLYKFIKRIVSRSLETDSYTLNSVAEELLGEKKDEVDLDQLSVVWDNKPNEIEKFCKYNVQDALLAYKLCRKILPNIEELVKIVGIPLYDISRMSFSQLVEWYVLKQIPQFNEIAPNNPGYNELVKRKGQTYQGAFVFEPKAGLYKDIVVFDFRSLYPSIIVSHNISPSTLNCECCEGDSEFAPTDKKQYWYCKKKRGFIPLLIEDLITRRMRIKEIMKEGRNKLLEARSESLKVLANSFYGYLGFPAARWYCIECADSITAWGRHYIHKVIDSAHEEGFKVIYSDTDSIFLTLEGKQQEDASRFVERINAALPGMMEMGYEGFYPSGIFVSAKIGPFGAKKKYALMDSEKNIIIKGFETVRRNWSFIAKEVQKKVIEIVLKEGDSLKAFDYVMNIIKELKENKIPAKDVVIFTQIQKETGDYDSVGPHVAAARRMKERGELVVPGTIIKYIIVKGNGVIRDKARLPDEVKNNEYDSEYYINNQIIPSVERIFEVLGYSKELFLVDKAQSKLGAFF